MTKEVWYLAHPVSDAPEANCHNTVAWLAWLEEHVPQRVYIAPWLGLVLAYTGRDVPRAVYDRALADDCVVVRRCDGILLVGGRISEGMHIEARAATDAGKRIADLSSYREPPPAGPVTESLVAALLMG